MIDLMKDPRTKIIIKRRGLDAQCMKLVEEMAELMVAITHMAKKDESCADYYSNFIEELGDVSILIAQIRSVLPYESAMAFDESVSYKLNREIKRLEDDKRDLPH